MAETEQSGVMSLTVTLLSAYFANNTVPSSELPALVEGTRKALLGDATSFAVPDEAQVEAAPAETPAPAAPNEETAAAEPEFKPVVSIDESLASADHILSLIDGKPYKALKRHLSTHGLTPAEYRKRYNLPSDYPLVAPGYSAARREVALKLGLGGKRKAGAAEPEATPEDNSASVPAPAPVEVAAEKPAPVRKARTKATKASATAKKTKPKTADGTDKPIVAAEPVVASPSEPAPVVEPVATKAVPEKKASTGGARAKAAAAKAPPKTSKAKNANNKPKPAATDAVVKPKRVRTKKVEPASAAPAETASVEATPAEAPAA